MYPETPMPAGIILPSPAASSLPSAHARLALAGGLALRFPGELSGAAWRPLGGPRFQLAASGRWGWVRQRLVVQGGDGPHLGTWLGCYEREGGGWTLIDATCAVETPRAADAA